MFASCHVYLGIALNMKRIKVDFNENHLYIIIILFKYIITAKKSSKDIAIR